MGGIKYKDQKFNKDAANTSASLLSLTMLALIVPAAMTNTNESDITALSRGVAVILLMMYVLYLFFQLKTHQELYEGQEEEEEAPLIDRSMGVMLLGFSTIVVSFCSDYLVASIEGVSEQWHCLLYTSPSPRD